MATTITINYRKLLNDIWGTSNTEIKDLMIGAITDSTFDKTNASHASLLLKIFINYLSLAKQGTCTTNSGIIDAQKVLLTNVINDVLSSGSFSAADQTNLQGIVNTLCPATPSTPPPGSGTSSGTGGPLMGIPRITNPSFQQMLKIIFKLAPGRASITSLSDIGGTELSDEELEAIFSVIYEGKSQGRTNGSLTSYLQGIRKFFARLFGISESRLNEAEWLFIAQGIKKVAEDQGIKNQYEQQALNTAKSSKKYEATLNYLKLKLQYVMTNDDAKKRKLQEKMNKLTSPAYNMVMRSNKITLDSLVQQIQNRLNTLTATTQSQEQQIASNRDALERARASAFSAHTRTAEPAPALETPARGTPASASETPARGTSAPAPAGTLASKFPGVKVTLYPPASAT